ncbi:unnamed protein product [Phaedon cochleariae]|uniref:Uncharacterized protein n=1 Tax=Phaedon cochleariae TaxID=80249 RepID=A0A9P0DT62_PHACE|nr:unnamed protein product [Phaedon cochleariae]
MPRESGRIVGALNGGGAGGVSPAFPVRKERLEGKSKKELRDEAARVLHQADRVDCVTDAGSGVSPEKFYTLPTRKKHKEFQAGSLDRRSLRRSSLEFNPLKKPPRTFAAVSTPNISEKTSIFDLFKKEKNPQKKKSNLRRSVSDVSQTKLKVYGQGDRRLKRSGSDSKELVKKTGEKKQLSPIIEVTQRDDYFSAPEDDTNKENIRNVRAPLRKKKKESITEKLKQYIDEVDEELYKETGVRVTLEEVKKPQPIIIDVDKAEKISSGGKKFKHTALGKKLKSITNRKNKTNDANNAKTLSKKEIRTEIQAPVSQENINKDIQDNSNTGPLIKAAIDNLEHPKESPKMIHSSQKPVEKLPLTRGRTVNSMVKRLSNDSGSPPPPKTSIMITPIASVQHNNNQPFSYTRSSPDKYIEHPPSLGSPIIYAQVVCGNNGNGLSKQTIHTTYTNGKKHPHSDSDEGLGGEENPGFIRLEKSITHFGDDKRNNQFFDEVDKQEEERPIKPNFRNPSYNGYSSHERKIEHKGYIDSSSRGRGDGMDAKRRESLTEPHENGLFSANLANGRSDLAARRDQLESRINRRLNDNSIRTSPEYVKHSSPSNVYISESTSKYYRGRSSSPVGYSEKFSSETRTDEYGKPHTTESRSTQYFGDPKDRLEFDNRLKSSGYYYNGSENEPKSFDSQLSDYRSSPENRKVETSHRYNRLEGHTLHKDRAMYKSTPEIHLRTHQEDHDSIRREKTDSRVSSKYRIDRYDDNERKDKFGDSGIENDFRRDSGENSRGTRSRNSRRDYCNESEDEGFASSLLIASERQHTENSINQRRRWEYDSDRTYSREDDPYRNLESLEYKEKYRSDNYAPRERSIDDGSHYDPRIDKDVERSTMKRIEKKPPKPEKKSGLDKVKSLFTRDSKKKKEKQQPGMVREEILRARYVEYKAREPVEEKYRRKDATETRTGQDYSHRRRLSTPSPSPTREPQRNGKSESSHGSWFKSLDRLSRKKPKAGEKEGNFTSGTEEETPSKPTPTKSLRFFGDTDIESNDSIGQKSSLKQRSATNLKARSQSTRDLHNISEENRTHNGLKSRSSSYKSMTNVSETERDVKGSRSNLKPPISPNHHVSRNTSSRQDKDRSRRRKNEVSSVESSTEGDSSQQSQRSIVYLHAATVGDIPGPGYLRNGRRSASREELASNSSSRLQPQVKTLSRSFSVLAPWRPRHVREGIDIDYTQYPKPVKNGKYEQKVNKSSSSRKDNSSTLKKKAQETRKNQANSTLKKSKENVSTQALRRSREDVSKGSSSTLYKKKERLPRENSRYSRDKEDRKVASKSLSVESLGSNGRKYREEGRDISRSVSMPRNPEKSAGWFKMSKKNNKLSSSTQRL